jgi:hypothetical protein
MESPAFNTLPVRLGNLGLMQALVARTSFNIERVTICTCCHWGFVD